MRAFLVTLLFMVLNSRCVTPQQPEIKPETAPTRAIVQIPERKATALTGTNFLNGLKNLSTEAREQAIWNEISSGNLPQFFRRFKPVKIMMQQPGKKPIHATIWVSPDYVAIGSDSNYVRVPMNPVTAQRIADKFGCILPTTKLVDIIYEQAEVKLNPSPMTPGSAMVSIDYFLRHNRTIEDQLRGRAMGKLVAGHKKDVVVTNKLLAQPTRVAIYGWHTAPKKPIQPLSLVHGYRYADYSHGIRLVSQYMQIDGKPAHASDVLKDPSKAALLSDEGPIAKPRIRISFGGFEETSF